MEIYELTVHELLDKLNKNEISSKEITESYLKRIDDKEKDVEAFVTRNENVLDEESEESVTSHNSILMKALREISTY